MQGMRALRLAVLDNNAEMADALLAYGAEANDINEMVW